MLSRLAGVPASKAEAGIRSRGPTLCVTPIAVMDFDPASLRMRLRSVHGGATESEVRKRTGFEFAPGAPAQTTPPPTPREIEVLRQRVDPEGLLRKGD